MPEYTPGPWAWEFFKDDQDRGQLQQYPIALSGQGPLSDVLVASSNYLDEMFIRIEPANARLIAAAPDLLAACETLKAWLGEADEVTGHDKRIWDMLDAAIAKATGKEGVI